MVDLFNSLGFKDAYKNGIEAEGLTMNSSRKGYTRARLSQLNEQGRILYAINAYISYCEDKDFAKVKIEGLSLGGSILPKQTNINVNLNMEDTVDNNKDYKTTKRLSQFDPLPSQLDNISDNVPVAFISYAWDNEEHKIWVKRLADDLRKNGVYSLLDQYKEKIDNLKDHSGASFEDRILTIYLYHGS